MTTTAGTDFQRDRSLDGGRVEPIHGKGRSQDPPNLTTDREALKLVALEAHSVRSEMKDWQNRSFLPAVASVSVVTAVQTIVEKVPATVPARLLVGVAALAVLMLSARLSWYCGFAIEKGKSYLKKYHQAFLEEHRQRETYSREAHRILAIFYLAFTSYLVFLLLPQATSLSIPLAIAIDLAFYGVVFIGRTGPLAWPNTNENQPGSVARAQPHYIEAEIKTLREDIRDWQTRRFTLASLAIATVGLAAITSSKLPKAAGTPSFLGLIALAALFWLTETGDRANRAASRTLRTDHSEWFPWEWRVHDVNKGFPRLKYILRHLYFTLAVILVATALADFR